ncbi:MAG TPA: Rv2578c family radical SAM protein [Jiangellaceae bacterium]
MRWQAQALDALDEGALPGLARIPGLLRSVRTPEFAGVTFHEVRARSVLNKVPEASRLPFRWTINPYRGCSHACVYCLAGDTPILMSDGRQKPLAEIRVGDTVIGTERTGRRRQYRPTDVHAHWSTTKPAVRLVLEDGTEFVASPDHQFLTTRGWQPVAELTLADQFVGAGALRRLPRHSRRRRIAGTTVTSEPGLRVASIGPVGPERSMYDITTGTGDFIANGVVSHNCFARGTHSWLELDTGTGFDSEIVVKVNAPDVVSRELGRSSWTREHVALGTNTDPYQRAEGRYRLMPGIIRALAGSGTPFSILTKGTLLRRDLPLLARAASEVEVGLAVSVAIYDEELHERLEPGAPSPRARLDLVRAVRDAGFDCGVLLAPVLPHMTDSVEHLEAAVSELAAAGATSITPIPLHLRPGAREWFMDWLGRERPDLVGPYEDLYGRGAYVPSSYGDAVASTLGPLLERYRLDRSARGRAPGIAAGHDDRRETAAVRSAGEQLTLM